MTLINGHTDTSPPTLTDFLLARISEDEAPTFEIVPYDCPPDCCAPAGYVGRACLICDAGPSFGGTVEAITEIAEEHAEQIHQRSRVLAECAAKAAIVEWHSETEECCEERYGPFVLEADPQLEVGTSAGGDLVVSQSFGYEPLIGCVTLMMLALPYADHEDYDESWRP